MESKDTHSQTMPSSSVIVEVSTKHAGGLRSTASSQLDSLVPSSPGDTSRVQTSRSNDDKEQQPGTSSKVSGRLIREPSRLGWSSDATFVASSADDDYDDSPKRGTFRGPRKNPASPSKCEELLRAKIGPSEMVLKLKEENDVMHKKFVDVKKKRALLFKDYQEVRKDLKQSKADKEELFRSFDTQKMTYEARLVEQEQKFFRAQESISELLKKGATDAMSDDFVRNELKKVKSMWRPWAKEWAAPSLGGLDRTTIRTFVEMCSRKKPPTMVDALCRRMLRLRSASSLLLNSMLAHAVCDSLFAEPFFFFSAARAPDGSSLKGAFDIVLKQGQSSKSSMSVTTQNPALY